MLLRDWLTLTNTTKAAFGGRIGVSPSAMTGISRGTRWVSARVARAIERETRGAVTVRDLLDGIQEWPEVPRPPAINRPGAPTVGRHRSTGDEARAGGLARSGAPGRDCGPC